MISDWLDGLLERLILRFGGLDLLQLILLGFTLESASLGLSVVISSLPFGFLQILVLVSLPTAWMLSRTRLPNWGFGLIGFLSGVLGLGLTVGRIGNALLDFLFSLFQVLNEWIKGKPVDLSPVLVFQKALGQSLVTLVVRLGNWFSQVRAHTLVIDPMVISILWGCALWSAVFWALWWVRRRANSLVGLLPAIALLSFNLFYTNSMNGITWLALTTGGILMLQASTSYDNARRRWATNHLQKEHIESKMAFWVVLLAVGMILIGGLLPSVPIHEIADAFREAFQPVNQSDLAESLGLQLTPSGASLAGTPTIPSATNSIQYLPIGPGPVLNKKVIMYVAVDGYNPPPINEYSTIISQLYIHYYWRVQTYDAYNGHYWMATSTRVEHLPAGQSIRSAGNITSLQGSTQQVTQHVTRLQVDDKSVFVTGELLSLDQPSSMLRSNSGEIISITSDQSRYTAVSLVRSPSVEQLRAAGSIYPSSINSYLELPNELPVRVRDLALNLTADQPTPYDRVVVLEAYLRQFPYSLEVPGPPSGRDAVDYFLFDLKKGYCDYYASAMVILSRAAGIPARLVQGYSEGLYDQSQGHFVVRASNAHAWVEIFFPDIGWVEFEPTSIQLLPFRPGQSSETELAINLPPPGREAPLSFHLERTWLGRLILDLSIAALIIILLLFLPLETWWLSLFSVDKVLKIIFHRLYPRGRFLGISPKPSRTPNEFAFAFCAALERFVGNRKYDSHIDGLRGDLEYLTSLYNRLLFSEHLLQKNEKHEAIRTWVHFRHTINHVKRSKKWHYIRFKLDEFTNTNN